MFLYVIHIRYILGPFGAQKWGFHTGTETRLFFGHKQYSYSLKESGLTLLAISLRLGGFSE